jgi:hypothetical protein
MKTLGASIQSSDLADFLTASRSRYPQGWRSVRAITREFDGSSVADVVDAVNADPESFEATVLPKMGLSIKHSG